MRTAFATIVSAVIAQLAAEPAVCEKIYRATGSVVPDQVDLAINVEFGRALPAVGAIAGAPIDWQSTISVDCFARSFTESGDLAVDPLLFAVFERLAQDPTLGGLIGDLTVAGVEAENSVEGKKTGWVRITYVADHRTNNSTLN